MGAREFQSIRITLRAMIKTARQPVIILGMHRSGTSMISELLDELGLFVGQHVQDDHESTFFLDINEKIMSRVNAAWDFPTPLLAFLACDDAIRMTTAAVAADLSSRRIKGFLGKGSLESFDKPWGWKDPRSVFTLPLWLKLFPEAKLVYIVRNAIDVAKSLMVREKKLLKLRCDRFDFRMARRSFRSYLDRAGYKGSPRCLTLQGGFDLWVEYVQQAEVNLSELSNPIHILKYEDMLAAPHANLPALAKFCGLDPARSQIEKAIEQIDGTRGSAFKSDPMSAAFYEKVKDNVWMKEFGYSKS
jgi:hypothetical protein